LSSYGLGEELYIALDKKTVALSSFSQVSPPSLSSRPPPSTNDGIDSLYCLSIIMKTQKNKLRGKTKQNKITPRLEAQ
jgi:hypothetical protein